MKKLYVYADFDWLLTPQLIGELSYASVRGNDTYGFSYNKEWLVKYGSIFLSDDLLNYTGMQYTRAGKDIFGCFSDALPDRWGRTLINRREQIAALAGHRSPRSLSSFDFLTGIDDEARMGGFRFTDTPGGEFINSSNDFKVPPIANIKDLMNAAQEIEISEEKKILPEIKWLAQLIHPGTSLGGARPKASIIDEKGHLTVAKFPSRADTYDVASWEHFCHIMGRKVGINVAETRIIPGNEYHILLSKRFDRTDRGKRIHFASALTLLGLNDGDNASNGYGYPDIADFIVQQGYNVEQNIEELYRRVAFYIIIGNTDDHFRNHGFLLNSKGWELSPAYDINPTLLRNQSLMINRSTNISDLNVLLESSEDYMLSHEKALRIIEEVKLGMKQWRKEAKRIKLPLRDIEMFAARFDN